jgi:ATP-binding cassette, subfamily G (WHITE), member 2, PDR
MYRVSPFTYLISAMLSTAVANTEVQCAANEYLAFAPLDGQTCAKYMGNYIKAAGGYLQPGTENNTTMCSYCTIGEANTYLASVNVYYEDRWRNFGIFFVYIVFNIFAALGVYWLARVPKKGKGFLGLGKKKEE